MRNSGLGFSISLLVTESPVSSTSRAKLTLISSTADFLDGRIITLETTLARSPGETSPYRCAGLNRYEAENAKFLRERISDLLGPEFCAGHREVHGEA